MNLPRIPLGDAAENVVDWINSDLQWLLDLIVTVLGYPLDLIIGALQFPPTLVTIALFTLLALTLRSWQFGLFTLAGMLLIESMELWPAAMTTLGMILTATLIIIVVGVPVGILAARSDRVSAIVRPVLDFMQTMPAFVFLIPVVILFSIGVVPGTVATMIFAFAPVVRLTELGIRQVDKETVEAGVAFGGTAGQVLRGIQLPLGLPTIMAGINQVIMLALSMAVIAGMVNAGGLGREVVAAISRVQVGSGFEAGLAVVILAIFLDRLTGAIGQPTGKTLWTVLSKQLRTARKQPGADGAAGEEAAVRVAAGPPKRL